MTVARCASGHVIVPRHAFRLEDSAIGYAIHHRSEQRRMLQKVPLKPCSFIDHIHITSTYVDAVMWPISRHGCKTAENIRTWCYGHNMRTSLWQWHDYHSGHSGLRPKIGVNRTWVGYKTQIQSETLKPRSVRLIGSVVWEEKADPISNVETAINKPDWERRTQHKHRSNEKRANREGLSVLGGAK